MTFFVPFDGSELSRTALVRAVEFADVFEERVVAASVVPAGNREYARERGWLHHDESFELSRVVARLHEQVASIAPAADFEHVTVGRFAPSGTIAGELRDLAREEDASIVFIGSENAGGLSSTLGSVGASVAAEDAYDVHIVQNGAPSKVSMLTDESPDTREKSDFYLP
ncbi:nucleotide-binding universal stress UspA family protein [Halarchaeum rubridurum]|uniref:Nucleotide-binding universal stress UspA family protein n=1 Tax=Halarchaeum rubridurum TaxID=489911 RepID=A0A830FTH4_9EURY|nr:universal stress protein [Halarchaeum rubridurum]MBP1954292.1 nucleotide-binding universal stress UspA family protein [Halarchaeum rubridurum]GGM58883.1 hypothetical protein GCM10009017_06260 [Halarchaeum rubridurum]